MMIAMLCYNITAIFIVIYFKINTALAMDFNLPMLLEVAGGGVGGMSGKEGCSALHQYWTFLVLYTQWQQCLELR